MQWNYKLELEMAAKHTITTPGYMSGVFFIHYFHNFYHLKFEGWRNSETSTDSDYGHLVLLKGVVSRNSFPTIVVKDALEASTGFVDSDKFFLL